MLHLMGAVSKAARVLAGLIAAGCGDPDPPEMVEDAGCEKGINLGFVAAPPAGEQEAYVCFGFDARELGPLGALRWTPPAEGPVALHHATLVATAEDYPDGPVDCGAMPKDTIGLHVWAPGGPALVLPDGIGFELPPSTRRLIVEAHVFRVAEGEASLARAELCPLIAAPRHRAAWLSVQAPVPAIRPRSLESAIGRCTLSNRFMLISTWPHMHFLGKEFHGAIVRSDGSRVPLVDLAKWDFNAQRTYLLDATLEPGDALETHCIWENPSDEYVLPGPFTKDEMCNQGFIGWPEEAARCELAQLGK
jgi:hypothetical protein